MSKESAIYDRIGGEEGIDSMVGKFYDRVLADPDLAKFFRDIPMDHLRRMQREFFSAATGGPIVYTGRPLGHVHQPLGISRHHFQRFTEHLLDTLGEVGISDQDINDIISRVNTYADEIVGEAGGVGD